MSSSTLSRFPWGPWRSGETLLLTGSRADTMAVMDVTVQWVRTTWSKLSRGAPHSTARSRAPEAFLLPTGSSPLLHEVLMREQDGFRPVFTVSAEVPGRDRILLREQEDELRVQVPSGGGAPERGYRPLVTIRSGEWMRWQINNRHTSYSGNWFYEMRTVNVAFGPVSREAFMGKPDHFVDERAALI